MMVDLPVIVLIYHDGDFDGEFRVTLMVIWWWFDGDFHGWFMMIYPWIQVIFWGFVGIYGDLTNYSLLLMGWRGD